MAERLGQIRPPLHPGLCRQIEKDLSLEPENIFAGRETCASRRHFTAVGNCQAESVSDQGKMRPKCKFSFVPKSISFGVGRLSNHLRGYRAAANAFCDPFTGSATRRTGISRVEVRGDARAVQFR